MKESYGSHPLNLKERLAHLLDLETKIIAGQVTPRAISEIIEFYSVR